MKKIPRNQWTSYSVPLSAHEREVIAAFVRRENMKQGEFLRRAALAYIEAFKEKGGA
jgi:hypothetical protein